MEPNFNPGLTLIRFSGTRNRRVMKNTSHKFHQKALNCKWKRQIDEDEDEVEIIDVFVLDLACWYRPHCVQCVLATSVKILP